MKAWLPVLHERLRDEAVIVRVVVATVRGSAPREPGACMLIGARRIDGTIGGGHLELKATEVAHWMLAQTAVPARLDRFALGATLGQCCGGAVNLWFERFEATDAVFVADALDAHRTGIPAVMVTLPRADGRLNRSVHAGGVQPPARNDPPDARITGAVETLLAAATDTPRARLVRMDGHEALLERIDPQGLPLWLFGAGHVGKALVRVLADLPFQVTWIDSRAHEFPAPPPDNVIVMEGDDPASLVDHAPPGTHFLVLTHSHDLDFEICCAILRRDDYAWAGLIGSETKAACFNVRFARAGIPPECVARLVSPIGITGIDSKLPGAIAVSVAAQLLQVVQTAEQSGAATATSLTMGSQTT